jgi:methylthioribose-1-phosphate isomerase
MTTSTPAPASPPPAGRPPTLRWVPENKPGGEIGVGLQGYLEIIDQRRLPSELVLLKLYTPEDVWHAIRHLAIRGAPAIGLAAAYGIVLAARAIPPASQSALLIDAVKSSGAYLKTSRPTAVHLEWAADQMIQVAISERFIGVRQLQIRLLREAELLRLEDAHMGMAIGRHGLRFIKPGGGVLTHCNAGALATAEQGTALAPLYEAHRRNIPFHVFVDETRPLLQGSRLTAWELASSGIDVTLLCDSMAGLVMRQKKVDLVLVGADRIARNGDTANKIGTYSLAQLARAHHIPFVVAAPTNTFDLKLSSGDQIPIEERPSSEITDTFGKPTAPPGIHAYNPAFDVTPAELITAIITERGIISPVNEAAVHALVAPSAPPA